MRPILLKISAFGSYAAEEIIDFNQVDRGIFLITGDTGSGKTTIFDAMTFALFDQTSGGKRETGDMRSQYAAADTPTFVEFIFSIKGETYRIKRNPRYFRTSKRRDKDGNLKLTQEAPMVELYLPGDVLFCGKLKETNEKIIEIIGLDVNQFTQTCMLAQGEFLKLLHASSSERKEIFARLFHTNLYEQIELKLRAEAKQMDKQLFENEALCVHELGNIQPMSSGEHVEEWAALCENWNGHKSARYIPMDEITGTLTDIVKEMDGVFRKADREVKCLEDMVQVEKRLLEKEEELHAADVKISQMDAYLQENQVLLSELQQKREDAGKRLLDAQEPMMQVITRLKDAMPKYERQQKIHEMVRKLQAESETYRQQIDRKGIAFLPADTTQELIKQEADLERELQEFAQKQKDLEAFEDILKEYSLTEKQRIEEQERTLESLRLSEEAGKRYEELNSAFIRAQVGIIAATLQDKKPCPVCGSTVHPSPAKILDDSITEDAVKQARAQRKQAEEALQKQQTKLQEVQLKENTLLTRITKEGEALFPQFVIGKAKEQCQEVRNVWREQQQGLQDCSKLLKLAQQIAALIEENAMLASSLPGEDYKGARKMLEETKARLKALQDDQQKTEEAFQKLDKELHQKKGALENARELHESVSKELALLKEQYALQKMQNQLAGIIPTSEESYTDIYHAAREKQQQIFLLLQQNREAAGKLKQLFQKRKEWIEQYEIISKLDKTANGTVAGAVKMDFQTYIQRQYFQKIIHEANKRLMRMSNQQFILKCKEIAENGTQKAAGLDLDVYSLVTDSTRDVKTLSGGESFMAALSMALGMSDVISASAGRIQMDTMFVDEGFGSLDEESRTQAIAILRELAGSNRLIGIISHVTELKEQIDRQLIVKKSDKGSSVSWSK